MENKNSYQADLFTNRLKKKYKELRKWARKNRISCYRLYDRDIPEIPLSLDVYEFLPDDISNTTDCAKFLASQNERITANAPSIEKEIEERRYAVLYLYERPYEKPAEEEQEWFNLMAISASSFACGGPPSAPFSALTYLPFAKFRIIFQLSPIKIKFINVRFC